MYKESRYKREDLLAGSGFMLIRDVNRKQGNT